MEKPTSTTDRPPGQRIGGSQWRHRSSDIQPWPWLLQQWCRSFYLALALTLSASGIAFAQSEGGCNSSNTTHSTEVDALVNILQGFHTTSIPGWGSSHDPCGQGNGNEGVQANGSGWAGVICQKISDGDCTTTVSGLQLADMNIKGNLSSHIQILKNLTLLIISGNPELTGPIPAELANLNELVILDFHDNAFSGTIPTFQNLYRLQFLDLSGNQIEGSIPGWLGTLQQLQKLDLSNNLLTGSLPVSKTNNSSGLNNMTSVVHMSFSRNNLIGGLDDLSSLRTLRTLNGSYNRFNSTFPAKLLQKENLPQLTVLDLSSNDLTGPMPDVSIVGLQQIYVANNSLSGSLPAGFVNSSSLQILNVDFNIISGTLDLQLLPQNSSALQMISIVNNSITQVQFPANTTTRDLALLAVNTTPWNHLFLGGNPYCNDPQTTLQLQICRSDSNQILTKRTTSTSQTNNNLLIILVTAAAAGVIVVLLLAHFLSIFCIRRLCQKIHSSPKELAKTEDVQPNLYSYNELKVATEDFSSDMRVGQGGLGIVYKGILPNDILVAVKKLNSSDLALAEFLNEIVTLSNVRHQNLVKLKGCCVKGDQRFVVYEYIENKNLAEALWDSPSKSGQQLNWAARFNIILGIARGLAYLHEEINPPIVHRDIKAANILLDSNLNPKIGDFGLALLFPALDEDRTHLSVNIAGTKGYLSPEYASLGQVSEKADVFSFGVLVLEIISGRKNINLRLPAEQRYILEWAWKLYEEDTLSDFIDAELADRSQVEDMKHVIKLGLACVQYSAARRPSMSHVVSVLLGNKTLDAINRDSELSKGELESMFATLQTSALTRVDEDSPLLVGLPTASASGAFIELGKLKPR